MNLLFTGDVIFWGLDILNYEMCEEIISKVKPYYYLKLEKKKK